MRLILGLIAILVIAFPSFRLHAARIRVSQESRPGAGDFDENVLGTIESADTGGVSAAEFYSYSEEYYYSFGGNGPRLRADTSQIFVVSAKEGLTLFIVHDSPDDEDGGIAVLRLKVEGDPDGADILVFDDPLRLGFLRNSAGSKALYRPPSLVSMLHGWSCVGYAGG